MSGIRRASGRRASPTRRTRDTGGNFSSWQSHKGHRLRVARPLPAAVGAVPLLAEVVVLVAVAVREERAAVVALLHLAGISFSDQLAGDFITRDVRRADVEVIVAHGSSLNTIRHTSTG